MIATTNTALLFVILMAGLAIRVQSVPVEKFHNLEGYGSIFIETEQKYNWFQAWDECASRNMTLITVDSADKSSALTAILKKTSGKRNLYIGGHDLGDEGRFVWSLTGKRFDFSNWSKGNPDNYKDLEDCAHIWEITDYEWNDTACNNKMGYICEDNRFLVAARRDLEIKKTFIEQLFSL